MSSSLQRSIAFTLSFCVLFGQTPLSYAQIVADPNGGAYRPDITTPPNTNNVPVVNITGPSNAGVSRNQYQQFDVQQQGVILNNNATNSNTQLAGWIQGNSNFAPGQSARIILNEVTSGNPTMLAGYIEVAGNRAEVIVANPAGIAVSGGGFINATSATLTTGKPIFAASGHLEAFRVGGNNARIQINGAFDTSTVDYTRIIARAVEINSGLWAKDLTVAAGTGDFAPNGTPIQLTVEDEAARPLFAIDVAQLGGMYAGKIHLIGTESGVGVRNAGHIGASVGQVAVTADGRLVNTGAINAQSQINLQAREINNSNTIYSQGTLTASSSNMVNAGIIAAQNDLTLQAQNIQNTEDALIAAGLDSDGGFTKSGNLTLQTNNTLTNAGTIAATQNLTITGNTTIDNKASGQIIAGRTLSTDINTLTNRGLLDGSTTHLKANSITNLGTGSIYGDHVAIVAATLTNKDEAGTGAVIAARDRMDLGIGTLYNQNDALLYAINDMNIGGSLDASLNAIGSATLIQNDGATIESGGNITISTEQLNNTNPTFEMVRESEYVGHVTKIHVGYQTYDISDIFVIRNVRTNSRYPYQGISGNITSAGSSLASLQGILGELDGRYIVLPSTNGKFPSDKFGPGVLGEIPSLAYIPYHEVTHGDPSEGGSVEIIQETFNYGPNSHLWELFGVAAPTARPEKPACMSSEWGCNSASQREQQRIYNEWQQANMPLYQALNGRIQEFWTDIQSRMVEDQFYVDDYDVRHYRDVVTASRPGEIIAGGNMTINITNPTGNFTNDKSRVMAGGDLVINGSVNNIDAKGEAFNTHTGTSAFTYMQSHSMGSDDRRWRATTLNITGVAREETLYVDATPESNASISGSNPDLSASDPNLPNNSFYTVNPGADKNYLIETDPRFTQYGKWLSSDYMLGQLGIDTSIHKRLGDGFYEQQLIREQIGQLTGYRFLAGYNSDEEQYKALMNAGVEYAQEHNLSVGVALTAEQMAALTSDIIWLISKDVTLPDGTVETVLVPQVYTRSGTNMITAGGTLISGNNVLIQELEGQSITLTNTATVAAREGLYVDASYIQNKVGQLHGNNVLLASAGDIDNLGGIISADNSITMIAERDINITSTVGHGIDDKGHISGIANTGVIYLSGEGQENQGVEAKNNSSSNSGNIHIQAGQDVNINGAYIINDAQTQTQAQLFEQELERDLETALADSQRSPSTTTASTTIIAGGDINLGTVTVAEGHNANFDDKNWRRENSSTEIGSSILTQGDINLSAGDHIGIRAGTLESETGAINAIADTITIEAGDASHYLGFASHIKNKDMFSSGSTTKVDETTDRTLVGSSLSAERINLQTTGDMTIRASDVVATNDVNLISTGGNINITSGEESTRVYSYERVKESGFAGSSGGIGYSKSQETTTDTTDYTYARGSTVGSLEGNINISAREGTYNQTGSDLLALAGDINVVAQDITIVEARESSRHEQTYEYKQSGLTIGINSPVMSMVQTAEKMSDAADRTESSRYKALAAGATAFNIYNNLGGFDAINEAVSQGKGPMSSGGLGLSVSLGSSKAESHSLEQSNTAKGSGIAAGGNINLIATGKQSEEEGKHTGGNILIRGSDISADQNIALVANENIHILAAQNTANREHSSKSSSSSIGASFGGGGLASVSVSASKSQGQGRGNEEYWSASHITAGDALTLVSGKDVNLIGSQISGNTVIADIGGNLRIESLQDKASEHNSFKSSGGSLTVGMDLNVGASYNQSKGNAHGDYASVNDYAGIMAGDGGFDITVGGNTHLKGGVISSTQDAVDNNKNQLITGSLTTEDIDNWSEYEAKSSSSNIGVGMEGGLSSLKPTGGSAGTAKESGSESSTTTSGISGGEIIITDEAKQQELTGKTAEETIEELNRDVITGELDTNGLTKDWDLQQLLDDLQAQAEITQEFGSQGAKAIGEYAVSKMESIAKEIYDLRRQPDTEENRQKIAALETEMSRWDEGGIYRIIAHTTIAGLGGGWDGALGAGGVALTAQQMNELQAYLVENGIPEGLAQTITAGISTGTGGIIAGDQGAAAGFNQDVNNRIPSQERIEAAKELANQYPGENQEMEELYYVAALCHIRKCSAGLKPPSEDATQEEKDFYNYITGLTELGGSPELQEYVDRVSAATIIDDDVNYGWGGEEVSLAPGYGWDDGLVDWSSRNDAGIRGLGTIQVAGGAATVAIGAAACETGVGCPAGVILIALGADNMQAGAQTVYLGVPVQTLTETGLMAAGFSQTEAIAIMALIEIGGASKINAGLKLAGATGSSGGKLLSAQQIAALEKMGYGAKPIATAPVFNSTETRIISEAQTILDSSAMKQIQEAHALGKSAIINVNGRVIQYEPNLPGSGMTMFGENGFLIGPQAFKSSAEFEKTIYHELHRLYTSRSAEGVSGDLAAREAKAAQDFADKAYDALRK